MTVGRVHERAQLFPGAQRRLHRGPVPGPVAVEGVGLSAPFVHAPVDLLDERRHPYRVHAQAVEVALVDPATHAGEIATLEVAQQPSVVRTAQRPIVAGITVLEAVREEKVDGRAVPKRRWAERSRRVGAALPDGSDSAGTPPGQEEG